MPRSSRASPWVNGGFYAYPLTNPVIIGDVTGDGSLSGLDAWYVSQKSVHRPVPQIPDVPMGLTLTFATVDPTVQIGEVGMVAAPGGTVDAVVRVTNDPHQLQIVSFTISYDTDLLALGDQDVTLSRSLAGTGWSLAENVDGAAGVVYVSMYSATPLAGPQDLLDLAFHVRADATAGTAPLAITGSLNEGQLVMTSVNGSIVVRGAEAAPLTLEAEAIGRLAWDSRLAGSAEVPLQPLAPSAAAVDRLMAADQEGSAALRLAGLAYSAPVAMKPSVAGRLITDDVLAELAAGRQRADRRASVRAIEDDVLAGSLDWTSPDAVGPGWGNRGRKA